MSWLAIIPEHEPSHRLLETADGNVIARELAAWRIRFEHWQPSTRSGAEPLTAYAPQVERLRADGYAHVDVVSVAPDVYDPGWADTARGMREMFRDEHTHAEDEVRFFTEGAALSYLRLGGNVYAVRCEAGDLLSVPAGTRHWFDMGVVPRFTAIRFFQTADGWVGSFSPDSIARRFPSFDELAAEEFPTAGRGLATPRVPGA